LRDIPQLSKAEGSGEGVVRGAVLSASGLDSNADAFLQFTSGNWPARVPAFAALATFSDATAIHAAAGRHPARNSASNFQERSSAGLAIVPSMSARTILSMSTRSSRRSSRGLRPKMQKATRWDRTGP
jgi:hypothetical protein